MLAKVISYAPTRRQAALVLADALARARLHGVRTNRELLVNVLRHPAFLDGATDTAFFDTHGLAKLSAPLADAATVRLSAIAAALADAAHNRAAAAGPRLSTQRLAQPRVRLSGQELPRRRRGTSTGSNTVSPERDWCSPATSRSSWSRPRRTRWCWPTATGWPTASRSRATVTTSTSTRRSDPFTWSRCPASPSRVRPSNRARWSRPCPAT